MKGPKSLVRREQHTFYAKNSERTVRDAAQLLGRLPNGWALLSLTYSSGEGWTAVVAGPAELVVPELDTP